ncbi:unnamed protein product [Amoebophrya sp. A25]|nr:unnamed protein product [Amoebophrya sp. A25]|eukprot:GSA25T00018363001.1
MPDVDSTVWGDVIASHRGLREFLWSFDRCEWSEVLKALAILGLQSVVIKYREQLASVDMAMLYKITRYAEKFEVFPATLKAISGAPKDALGFLPASRRSRTGSGDAASWGGSRRFSEETTSMRARATPKRRPRASARPLNSYSVSNSTSKTTRRLNLSRASGYVPSGAPDIYFSRPPPVVARKAAFGTSAATYRFARMGPPFADAMDVLAMNRKSTGSTALRRFATPRSNGGTRPNSSRGFAGGASSSSSRPQSARNAREESARRRSLSARSRREQALFTSRSARSERSENHDSYVYEDDLVDDVDQAAFSEMSRPMSRRSRGDRSRSRSGSARGLADSGNVTISPAKGRTRTAPRNAPASECRAKRVGLELLRSSGEDFINGPEGAAYQVQQRDVVDGGIQAHQPSSNNPFAFDPMPRPFTAPSGDRPHEPLRLRDFAPQAVANEVGTNLAAFNNYQNQVQMASRGGGVAGGAVGSSCTMLSPRTGVPVPSMLSPRRRDGDLDMNNMLGGAGPTRRDILMQGSLDGAGGGGGGTRINLVPQEQEPPARTMLGATSEQAPVPAQQQAACSPLRTVDDILNGPPPNEDPRVQRATGGSTTGSSKRNPPLPTSFFVSTSSPKPIRGGGSAARNRASSGAGQVPVDVAGHLSSADVAGDSLVEQVTLAASGGEIRTALRGGGASSSSASDNATTGAVPHYDISTFLSTRTSPTSGGGGGVSGGHMSGTAAATIPGDQQGGEVQDLIRTLRNKPPLYTSPLGTSQSQRGQQENDMLVRDVDVFQVGSTSQVGSKLSSIMSQSNGSGTVGLGQTTSSKEDILQRSTGSRPGSAKRLRDQIVARQESAGELPLSQLPSRSERRTRHINANSLDAANGRVRNARAFTYRF